jgi:hypothetical protein
MNTIEERIRAAARAAADTVPPDGVPPLELPVRHPRSRRVWRARWLAPAAAAAAVVAIVVAAAFVGGGGSPAPAGPAVSTVSPATGARSVSSYVESGQIPPYYVAIVYTAPLGTVGPTYAVVHDTVTGKALATIRPSVPGGAIMAATAAADDRTFILEEQPLTGPARDQGWAPRTFYRFRLDAAGRPGPVTKLPMSLPQGRALTGFALSADGSKLALADTVLVDDRANGPTSITVYTLATGQSHTWTAVGYMNGAQADDARALSWTSDGRTLAFNWQGYHLNQTGEWLLDTARGGSNLLADSRLAVSFVFHVGYLGCVWGDAIITPDGSAVVCGGGKEPSPANIQAKTDSGFLEYSTVTGKVQRILGHWSNVNPDPLWSSPSGNLLIGIGGPRGQVGVISGSTFTPLPASMPDVNTYPLYW